MTNIEQKALVERLRDFVIAEDIDLAADRIEALSAENERLRDTLRNAIRFIDNLIYDIKCHTECAECQSNVAMYEHTVEEYRAALGDTK